MLTYSPSDRLYQITGCKSVAEKGKSIGNTIAVVNRNHDLQLVRHCQPKNARTSRIYNLPKPQNSSTEDETELGMGDPHNFHWGLAMFAQGLSKRNYQTRLQQWPQTADPDTSPYSSNATQYHFYSSLRLLLQYLPLPEVYAKSLGLGFDTV